MVSDTTQSIGTSPQQTPHDVGLLLDVAERQSAPPFWREALFWLTLTLTAFAVAPFTLPGYFWGAHDARHHVYFLFEYDRLVQDGIWWPRWSPDFAFGYGYPFFNIYGPFSHFLAEVLLHFFNFSHTAAIETIFGLSIVASAAAMYLFVRSWLGSVAALLSALTYVYIPYHLLNLYVRANLAESMAFVWLPLCLWTVRQAVRQPRLRWVIGIALSYAGLMLTSNLVIVLFTPLLGAYLLTLILVYSIPLTSTLVRLPLSVRVGIWLRTALTPALGLLAGLGLSAIFWLPAFVERNDVRVDQWFAARYDFRPNFVYFFQLFSPRWDFGVSQAGPDDPFSFQIGVAALALAVIGLLALWPLIRRERWEVGYFLAATLLTAGMTLQSAAPLWELPLIGAVLNSAQFPWRWLSITALCISVLAGQIGYPLLLQTERRLTLPLLTLIAVILLSSYPYLQVQIRAPAEGPVSLAALMKFQQSSDEMTGSTRWVKEIPKWSSTADYYISQEQAGKPVEPINTKIDYGNAQWPFDDTFGAHSVKHNTIMEEVYFNNLRDSETRIVFNHFYYPGWKAYLLNREGGEPVQELPIIPEETGTLGRMTVPLPKGEGHLLLRFEDTPIRTRSRYISLTTLALLCLSVLNHWGRVRIAPVRQ